MTIYSYGEYGHIIISNMLRAMFQHISPRNIEPFKVEEFLSWALGPVAAAHLILEDETARGNENVQMADALRVLEKSTRWGITFFPDVSELGDWDQS
jgi:hypothetical protein